MILPQMFSWAQSAAGEARPTSHRLKPNEVWDTEDRSAAKKSKAKRLPDSDASISGDSMSEDAEVRSRHHQNYRAVKYNASLFSGQLSWVISNPFPGFPKVTAAYKPPFP